MKETLLILVIVALGALQWHTEKTQKRERAEFETTVSDYKETITSLRADLAATKRQKSTPDESEEVDQTSTVASGAESLKPVGNNSSQSDLAVRLADLELQYNQKLDYLKQQETLLSNNEADGNSKLQYLRNNPPSFKERGSGSIRTSDKDREPIMASYNGQIAQLNEYLNNIRLAKSQLYQDKQTLNRNYQTAIAAEKAK